MDKFVYQMVVTKSGTVGYAKSGSGYPLILIVGYTGTLFHWNDAFIKVLARYFTVYLVDNRKIGLSDSKNQESLAGLADDIADFICAMDLVKPIIFGWSMGGVVAQELTRNYAGLVGGLVLMATVPNMQVVNPEFSELTSNSDRYSQSDYKARLYNFFFSEAPGPETKGNIAKNAVKLDNYHYRYTPAAKELQDRIIPVWQGMTDKDYHKLELPALILWAKNDLVVPFAAEKFIVDNIRHSKLIVYPTGGHFIIHINPHQIAEDVINFFQYTMKE